MTHIKLTFLQHVRAVQAKEKPPTSYTFTLIKTRVQASFPSFKGMASNMVSSTLLMSFEQKAVSFDLRLMKMNMWPLRASAQ